MTNLIQELESDASALVAKVKSFFETNPTAVAVENDVSSFLSQAWAILERNGGSLLVAAATNVVPAIVSGQWAVAVASALADAKAAGAVTVPAEENLAASLALQAAQTIAGVASVAAPAAEAPVPAPEAEQAPAEAVVAPTDVTA